MVLFGVEEFEEGICWIATEVGTELINLIKHEDRIEARSIFHTLDDPPGHRSNIGAAMSPNLRLITDTSQAYPYKGASHRLGNTLTEARLTNPGWADEAEDRDTLVGARKLAHRNKLQDAILHPGEAIVVLLQDLLCTT